MDFNLFRAFESPPVMGAVVAVYQMVIIVLLPFLLMSSSYYKVNKRLDLRIMK